MQIKPETAEQRRAIHELIVAAFPTPAEAELVDRLRTSAHPHIALVAEDAGVVVGHILFTPVQLDTNPSLSVQGLAPLAVSPDHQRQGIGAALIRAGLEACRQLGTGAVCVLGAPDYYGRFGFEPASLFGLKSVYPVPEEVFMVLELSSGYLMNTTGVLQYHGEFDKL